MSRIQRFLPTASARSVTPILLFLLAAAAGCQRQPYGCVPVSGKLTYEDGSPIPADRIRLTFFPQAPSADPKITPRVGVALVDVNSGAFSSATTYTPNDGLIAGEHKVIVMCYAGSQVRPDFVGDEYADAKRTPLKVDTSHLPFELKIPKPRAQAQ